MIDIENAYKEFDKYVSNYNPHHPRVALKIDHIKRVAIASKEIAESLNLSEEQIKLAELIGLFHDLGRFEQVRIADTFSDKDSGINHAEQSNKVLFEDGLIRNFIEDTKYDEIIRKSVFNHNRAYIEDGLSDEELLFAKIIRDADKVDIFYTITISPFPALFWYKDFDTETINPKVMADVENLRLIDYKNIHNNSDQLPIFYAYLFDLNFPISLKKVADGHYLEDFTTRVKQEFSSPNIHTQADHLLNICNEYISKKMK